ncbi:hypothetical protein [Streptomyces microflavus]|uniref:Uncharacterized protein n=1 Tax=Streptomyces microflavus TaxID=1919 RepID=A0A7H8MZI2_STRMI|nr:hypothetical protein [Streptomyces microflavus]QKW47677.1 hypothetical protein HUT09_34870 [Streptomyces microflavus]
MDSDVEGIGERFVHLPQLADLLERVAPPVEVTPEQVKGLLPSCIHHFQSVASATWGSPLSALAAPYPALSRSTGLVESARGWLGPPGAMHLEVLQVDDIQGYKLGAEEWFTASVQWQVIGLMHFDARLSIGCCTWETRILMPLVQGGPTPRILHAEHPKAPDRESVSWPTIPLNGLSHLPAARDLLTAFESESRLVRTLAMINYALSGLRGQVAEVPVVTEADVLAAMAIAEEGKQDPPGDDDS